MDAFSSLVHLDVCCVAVFVCASVLKKEFTSISNVLLCNICVNSCMNKRWHPKKNAAGVMCLLGYELGAL